MCAQLPWSPAQSKPGGVNHNAQNGRDPHAAHVCTVRRVWAVVFRTWGAANNGKSGAAHVGLSRPASSANIQTFRPASETVNKLVSNPLLRSMVFPGVASASSTAPRRCTAVRGVLVLASSYVSPLKKNLDTAVWMMWPSEVVYTSNVGVNGNPGESSEVFFEAGQVGMNSQPCQCRPWFDALGGRVACWSGCRSGVW